MSATLPIGSLYHLPSPAPIGDGAMGDEKRVEVVRHSNDAAISPPVTLHGRGGKQLELSCFEVLHFLDIKEQRLLL